MGKQGEHRHGHLYQPSATRQKSGTLRTLLFALGIILSTCLVACGSSADSGVGNTGATDATTGAAAESTDISTAAATPAVSLADLTQEALQLEYNGEPAAIVNGDVPAFTEDDLARGSFEEYSFLDHLGRCGTAFALVGPEVMPTEERQDISQVHPSGWQVSTYDWVDQYYLFNRCHLLGYQLTGENANELNLITGTRYMNVQGMEPLENQVATYARNSGNHVLYRVTPVFHEDDLVARGVLIEAKSVEDNGADLQFCRWCFNVEPGVIIDYATGANHAAPDRAIAEGSQTAAAAEISEEAGVAAEPGLGEGAATIGAAAGAAVGTDVGADATAEDQAADATTSTQSEERDYVLNTNTHRFHYPWCDSVTDMKEKNKQEFHGTREEALEMGYKSCGRCNP